MCPPTSPLPTSSRSYSPAYGTFLPPYGTHLPAAEIYGTHSIYGTITVLKAPIPTDTPHCPFAAIPHKLYQPTKLFRPLKLYELPKLCKPTKLCKSQTVNQSISQTRPAGPAGIRANGERPNPTLNSTS